jgi:thiol:disulfide interchange protein DsbC
VNKLLTTLLALAGAFALSTPARADVEAVRRSISEKMPGVQIRSVTKSPYGGLYEVVVNGFNVFYTDEKGDTGFFGKMVDLRTRTDLTEKRTQELMVVDFSRLPLDKAIIKVKGDGSRKLVLFSDPDCPFCRQLEKELEGVTNVTMYTFLYPLTSIHPDAMRKAEIIWCSADRARAYYDLMLEGKEPAGGRDCDTPIKEVIALAETLWIRGTPGMIFANGRLVPGTLQRHQIEALLDTAGKFQATAQ